MILRPQGLMALGFFAATMAASTPPAATAQTVANATW